MQVYGLRATWRLRQYQIPRGRQVGSLTDQEPSGWHVRVLIPCILYPGLHMYVAL
jgi:hypothetical protein